MRGFIKGIVLVLCIFIFCYSLLGAESYLGEKAPTEPKAVGDIVFNDGSATSYREGLELSSQQKAAVVSVIFYVGTDCSDDDSIHTLGIGMKTSQKYLKWCDKKASAAFEGIETIYDTTKNGRHNFEKISEWLNEHGKSDDTKDEKKYPAFYFAKNYANQVKNLGKFSSDWYLPSKAEIFKACEQFDTIKAVSEICKLPLIQGPCWTSTMRFQEDFPGATAWKCYFYNEEEMAGSGIFDGNSKYCSWLVCAIREF